MTWFALVAACLAVLTLRGAGATGAAPADPTPPALDPCGTWSALAPKAGDATAALAVRPPEGPLKVFSAHVVVHYSGAGLAAYAQDVSDAAELTYRVLVDTLAHLPPLPDGTAGGDARLDIYLRPPAALGSVYGVTYPETLVGSPYANSYTAWIELVDTLSVPSRVTYTAHEFYHTIQVVYDRVESVYLLEMFSTWVQDRVYDAYNLHYPTLRLFFRQPQRGLFSQFYSNVPWAIYLTERFGDGIMKDTLVECAQVAGANPREAFDAALTASYGTTFLDAFIDFGTFNYFVAARDDGAHYSEGTEYYVTTVERRTLCYPEPVFVSIHPPAQLGANYALFDGDAHSGALEVTIYPEYLASTILTLTRFKGATRTSSTKFYPMFMSAQDVIVIADWEQCDSVLAVYQVNTGSADNSFAFAAEHVDAAAPPGDWFLVLDRDGCRAPFNGVDDEFRDRDGEENPIATAIRDLGGTAVVVDSLPDDLSQCRAIFVVAGFDAGGATLTTAELNTLNAFMDGGGDIYVEGSRLGEFMDPSLGAGDATEQAFWNRFGCSFVPGLASGNLTSWSTTGNSFMGQHEFSYDPGAPNQFVGVLVPTSAGYLAKDGAGTVRATVRRAEAGSSTRIMSTVLLGGSTGTGGSTRTGFVSDVLSLFDANVASLAVARASVSVSGRDVSIDGVLEHYDGQLLELERVTGSARAGVPMTLRRLGGEWRFSARDRFDGARATYRLLDVEEQRIIWQQEVEERTPALALRLTDVYPNPARDDVRLVVETPVDEAASIGIYDVAGRRVSQESAPLRRGANTITVRALPAISGLYFVRVDTPSGQARGRLLVLR